MRNKSTPSAYALTIAGSDSGGGAGIQADLRAFASQGVFGLSAITAITAQNTSAVSAVQVTRPAVVRAQVDAVASDFPLSAIKTGMLANVAITRAVARLAARMGLAWIVDPVMIASSGGRLLDTAAETALREDLLPHARVLTPNIPEAQALLGISITRVGQMERAAEQLCALGASAVLLKGGHLSGREVVDVYFEAGAVTAFCAPRQRLQGHGTGCTLAALLAARYALGEVGVNAVSNAISAFRIAFDQGADVGSLQVRVPYPVGRPLQSA